MSSSRASADRLYAALRQHLEPTGIASRAASSTSSELWMAAALSGGQIGPDLLESSPDVVAEQVVSHRLERLITGLILSLDDEFTGAVGAIHIRPLRSALHAAFTLPLGNGGLIVIDDATYDLTHSAAMLMMASWGRGDPTSPDGTPPPLPFNDAVRVLRAEIGSMRWNGALWQPVQVVLSEAGRGTAAVLSDWAVCFIIAHEIGHLALGHFDRNSEASYVRTRLEEHAADVFAARALLSHVFASHPDPAPHRVDLTAVVRTAIRLALGIVHVVSTTYLVAGDDHPPVTSRLAEISDAVMPGLSTQVAERPIEQLFEAMDNLVLATVPPLSAIVADRPALALAAAFTEAEVAELDSLDRSEAMFHSGLPNLLYALGDAVLGESERSFPQAVLDAAKRADEINCTDRDIGPLPAASWVRFAVGRWWLREEIVDSRPRAEVSAALSPPSATRELLGIALAALLVYAQHGEDADGVALTESGLIAEVRRWRGQAPTGAAPSSL
jgi:hypothetical protein